jgi:hypothetical protein
MLEPLETGQVTLWSCEFFRAVIVAVDAAAKFSTYKMSKAAISSERR